MKCHLLWTMTVQTLHFPLFHFFSYPLISLSQRPSWWRKQTRSEANLYMAVPELHRSGKASNIRLRLNPVAKWYLCCARRGLSALFEINMADICNFYTLGLSSASFASISMTKAAIRILELNIILLSCCVFTGFPPLVFGSFPFFFDWMCDCHHGFVCISASALEVG